MERNSTEKAGEQASIRAVEVTPAPNAGIQFYGVENVYSESGIDILQLRENLKQSFSQRLIDNSRFVAFLDKWQGSTSIQEQALQLMDQPVFEPEQLLHCLDAHQVHFVVIGGLAMISHGSATITKDLDICYERTPKNMEALAMALANLHSYMRGAPPGLPFRFDSLTIQAGLNFTFRTDLGDVDTLGEVSGIGSYAEALARSIEKNIGGMKIRVLSLDGLLAAKKAAGRTKDRLHILELEELKKIQHAAQGEAPHD